MLIIIACHQLKEKGREDSEKRREIDRETHDGVTFDRERHFAVFSLLLCKFTKEILE